MFELRQNPTTNQQKFISQWQTDGYSTALIHYAYEKTVEQINKVEAYRPQDGFEDALKGLYAFGGLVTRPEEIVVLKTAI